MSRHVLKGANVSSLSSKPNLALHADHLLCNNNKLLKTKGQKPFDLISHTTNPFFHK
ncbi:hypothetical protein ACE6H2_021482 [Prunus campanulata]